MSTGRTAASDSIDTTKLESLGYRIDRSFDDALARTVDWYVKNEPWKGS
jgi:dTDP-D-glucose 4,6-dehydratase